jgi:hypothetical protein
MAPAMTLERLGDLLDAYGARLHGCSAAERAAAETLIAGSPEARALRDAAARLDALLDRAPAVEPSAALSARILAGRPRPKVVRLPTRVVAAVGLAAAATVAVWLVRRPEAPRALEPAVLAELGEYETPTDALLAATDPEVDEVVPAFGCDDPEVACEEAEPPALRPSATRSPGEKEMHA